MRRSFPSTKSETDAAGEAAPAERNVGNRQHDAVAVMTALRPHIAAGKRRSAVALKVAASVAEPHVFPVHGQRTVHPMIEAENAVAALKQRCEAERTHNVPKGWSKRTERECAFQRAALGVHVELTAARGKDTVPETHEKLVPVGVKFLCGEGKPEGFLAADDLQRRGDASCSVHMVGWNQGKRIRTILLLEVPAFEIGAALSRAVKATHVKFPCALGKFRQFCFESTPCFSPLCLAWAEQRKINTH